jgi:hypothetical protein
MLAMITQHVGSKSIDHMLSVAGLRSLPMWLLAESLRLICWNACELGCMHVACAMVSFVAG